MRRKGLSPTIGLSERGENAKVAEIDAAFLANQGAPADLGGYYAPDEAKTTAVMRPVAEFNEIVDALKK